MACFEVSWVLGGQLFQEIIQTLEAFFPYLPVALEPLICLGEGASFQTTWPALSVPSTRNQTCPLKNTEVLGNSRLANREGLHELGNGGLT
ncbi:MAG: hypothetical protein QOH35_3402 [Acidobacteriaceae bacterium]|jgi:hypothetical protein|nr:hypothetical protein [Acidobacteriaceae bacterium]